MNDQSKQAPKTQPTDIISSIKNKTDLKETEKNNALDNEWNDYSDNEEDDTPIQNQTAVKEKENKDKTQPQKLGDILSNKQPIQQNKKPYNKQRNDDQRRNNKEGGIKKFYNNNVDQKDKNTFSNQNPNYVRKNKEDDRKEIDKRIGNVANILANNEKKNEGFKATKTYDDKPEQQNTTTNTSEISKPQFKNDALKDTNLRKLNDEEDLFLKNMKNKGMDKEPVNENVDEKDDKNKQRKPYNKDNYNKKPYNKNYQNKPRYNNNNNENTGVKPEKEVDEDGFEKVVNKPKKTQTNYRYNNNNNNYNSNNQRWNDNEREESNVQESGETNQRENEEEDKQTDNDRKRHERKNRDGNNRDNRGEQGMNKGEHRERKDKKGGQTQKTETVWETEAEFNQKQEKEVEVQKQPTKVEFTMKATGLKDLFAKKK